MDGPGGYADGYCRQPAEAVEGFRSGENGFLHSPRDVDGMAATITDLLAAPERLEKVEREARRTAVEEFPVARAVDAYVRLYEEAGT